MTTNRGHYSEIVSIDGVDAGKILGSYGDALPELGIEEAAGRGRHKGWVAVNADLYGHDAAQDVAVVQIRRSAFDGKYRETHKDYVLVGRTESGGVFRHPVSAAAVRAAIRKDPSASSSVAAAQCWMFGVKPEKLAKSVRQGDVLLSPERSGPKGGVEELGTGIVVGESHAVEAARVVRDAKGTVWALDPIVRHSKGQHADVCGDEVDRWHTVRLAKEAPTWSFTGGRLKD